MGQDFTKGLNVCIGNYGYYNEGSLHDAWITLPKTEAEIRDFLHLNQLQDSQHEEIYISDSARRADNPVQARKTFRSKVVTLNR